MAHHPWAHLLQPTASLRRHATPSAVAHRLLRHGPSCGRPKLADAPERPPPATRRTPRGRRHARCRARCLFISNMVTRSLPKTLPSLSSARISRRFSGFCRLFDLMYSHTLLTTSPRGSGPGPTTAASSSDGLNGCCSAFGLPPPVAFFSGAIFGVLIDIIPLQLASSSSHALGRRAAKAAPVAADACAAVSSGPHGRTRRRRRTPARDRGPLPARGR